MVRTGARAGDRPFVERLRTRLRIARGNRQFVERLRVESALDERAPEMQASHRIVGRRRQPPAISVDLVFVLKGLEDRVVQERFNQFEQERRRLHRPDDVERVLPAAEFLRQQQSKRQRQAQRKRQQARQVARQDAGEAGTSGIGDFRRDAALAGSRQRGVAKNARRAVREVRSRAIEIVRTVDRRMDRVVAGWFAIEHAKPRLRDGERTADRLDAAFEHRRRQRSQVGERISHGRAAARSSFGSWSSPISRRSQSCRSQAFRSPSRAKLSIARSRYG